jgi:hypothetical protein
MTMTTSIQILGNSRLKFQRFALTLFCLGAAALALASCGIGVQSDDTYRAQQEKDAATLKARYDVFRGTYEGQLVSLDGKVAPVAARLVVTTDIVIDPTPNPDGSPRKRALMSGRFELTQGVSETDRLVMTGDLSPDGTLVLSSEANNQTQVGDGSSEPLTLSVSGPISGEAIHLQVNRSHTSWGRFDAKKTSSEPISPVNGYDEEYSRKVCNILKNIKGTYYNPTTNIPGFGGPQGVRVILAIQKTPVGHQGAGIPILSATVELTNGTTLPRQLDTVYSFSTGQISMKSSASAGLPVSGDGVIRGDQLIASFQFPKFSFDFSAKKTKTSDQSQNDFCNLVGM